MFATLPLLASDVNFCSRFFSLCLSPCISVHFALLFFSHLFKGLWVFFYLGLCARCCSLFSFLFFQAACRAGCSAGWGCQQQRAQDRFKLFTFLSFTSGCVVLMSVYVFSIHTQRKLRLSFRFWRQNGFLKNIPFQLSSLPHFSISPLNSTLPAPLALSCHSPSLSWCHSLTGGP